MCCRLLDAALDKQCKENMSAIVVGCGCRMIGSSNRVQVGLPALPVPRKSIAHPDFFKPV